jgi:hypothetical protein
MVVLFAIYAVFVSFADWKAKTKAADYIAVYGVDQYDRGSGLTCFGAINSSLSRHRERLIMEDPWSFLAFFFKVWIIRASCLILRSTPR